LAGLYLETDAAKSEQYIADALKIHPGDNTLRIIQVKIFSKENKNDAVVATLKSLIKDNPDNLLYPSQLANFYIASNRIDDAEALMRQVVAQQPDKDEAKLLLVEFLSKQRSIE